MGGNRLSRRRYSWPLSRAVGLGRHPPRGGTSPLAGEHQKEVFWKVDQARRVACRCAAFRRCWRVGVLMKRGTKTKKGGRYAEPWVPVQEGRERQLAWPGPWKLRRPGGYQPGGFHIGNLMIRG